MDIDMKHQAARSNVSPIDHSQEGSVTLSADVDRVSQESAQGREPVSKWAVMAIVAIGVFMATLDSSIVNISLPTIAHYFGVPLSGSVEWVIIAYLIATAAILLTAGRLADMIGRKIVWSAGLIIFTVGSAICGTASNLTILIVARLF